MENKHQLEFRRATKDDVEMLVHFERVVTDPKLYGVSLSPEWVEKEILENNYYCVFSENRLVGTAAYCIRADGSGYLSNIAVDPACRRRGIARAAMEFLLSHCIQAQRVDLTVHPENHRALALYESFGFCAESLKENYYGDGEPRLILVREQYHVH